MRVFKDEVQMKAQGKKIKKKTEKSKGKDDGEISLGVSSDGIQ